MKGPSLNQSPRNQRSPPKRSPGRPTTGKNHDGLKMAQAHALSQHTAAQSSLGVDRAPGGTTTTAGAPVATSVSLAPPGPLQSQRSKAAVVAAMKLKLKHQAEAQAQALLKEYQQQQRQQELAAEARLQQAWRASFEEYQRQQALAAEYQRQQALAAEAEYQRQQAFAAEAGLQQAWAWAAAAPQQSQVLMLYTVDGGAAGYETKWDELHPVSRGLLLQIEDKIREYRDDCEQLDQCSRLDDLSRFNFEFYDVQIIQEATSFSNIMNREKISIESLLTVIKEIMWNTEFAICSYAKLKRRFVHLSAGTANHSGTSGAQTDFSMPRRPSPFVQHTVARFEDHLGVCYKWILELEQHVQTKNDKTFAESLESLSKVMSNVNDYLIHVASKLEHTHQCVETMKTQYLNDRRFRGDLSNPFLKANRREEAKQEATARIMHPTSHVSPASPPTTLVAVPMISSEPQQTSFPSVATSPSSYPTLPMPSVLPPSSMQTSPSPLTHPFSSPGSGLQSTPFGSFSTLALGSTPAASLLGTGIPSSATSFSPVPSGGGTAASGIDPVHSAGGRHRHGRSC